MRYVVPIDAESSEASTTEFSTSDEFYPACENIDSNFFEEMADVNMSENELPPIEQIQVLNPENVNLITNFTLTLRNAPSQIQDLLRTLGEGQISTQLSSTDRDTTLLTNDSNVEKVMKKDASFEKWNDDSLSWTSHYYLLKTQCHIYKPLLVTDEAVCMKIYESIPEPQRQSIRGYWIRCGEKEQFDWKEMLSVFHEEYFDKVGAQKAERKLLAMR